MKLLKRIPELGFPVKKHTIQQCGRSGKFVPLRPNNPYTILEIVDLAGDVNLTLNDYSLFIQENIKGLYGKCTFLTEETLQYLYFGISNYAVGWGRRINKEDKRFLLIAAVANFLLSKLSYLRYQHSLYCCG